MRPVAILIVTITLGLCSGIFAQNPYIRHYTTSNGLPTNTVYQIYQDSHKFLWFATNAGLVKFDGSKFTTFTKKNGLSSNDIVRIKEDYKGRIWIFGYNSSVDYFFNNKIYNRQNTPFLYSLMGNGFIFDFFSDSNKTIYFYNWQREIYSLDSNNKILKDTLLKNCVSELPTLKSNINRFKILYVNKNSSGLWNVWTNWGIYGQYKLENRRANIINSSLNCEAVFPARDNTFYVWTPYIGSTTGELIKVSGSFLKEKINFPGSIYKIKSIIEDSEGYLWISAYDEGVYCLKNNKVIKHFDVGNALGLLQDNEQNIWVSSQSDGIYVINHDLLKQNHFTPVHFDDLGVKYLCDFPGTGVWCTNSKSVFLMSNNIFFKLSVPKDIQPVNLLYFFKDRTLLLGSISQLLYTLKYTELNVNTKNICFKNDKFHSFLTKNITNDLNGDEIALFDQNRILFSSALKPSLNSEFNKISERINNAYYNAKNEFVINAKKNYLYKNKKLLPYPELSRFNEMIISDHLIMDKTTELFNIDGDSLYIFKNNKFYNLTSAFDTPIDLQIKKILYKDSTLYIATLKDIFVCRYPTRVFSGISLNLVPLNISFNNINDFLFHDDTLYIASDDGLTTIAESAIGKSTAQPPLPYLQTITVNDKLYLLPDQELKLTGQNIIQLSFGCISYSSGSVFYSYKLEGSENNWTVGTGSGINLVYQNLPRGHYVFKLRTRKSNSAWSKPIELAITIKPTLLEHPAFWTFVVLLSSGLLILIITLIRIQKMKRVEVDHQLIVMEQKALQSMMNPHFIFNSLGSIQNYLLKNKGNEAVIYLSQFAHLIRQNLNAINTPMIILEEEIERMKNYLDLEKKRLENKFDYYIDIDPKLEEEGVFIPSMIIQPIAENSIWHGLATRDDKGFIKLSFQDYTPKSLKIIIEDNGIGMKKALEYSGKESHHKHMGMQILEKRLNLLSKKYNVETSISYAECYPGSDNPGTVVELILPFLHNTDDNQD